MLRIPAQEIETLLEKKVRAWFADTHNLANLTGKDHTMDHEVLVHLSSSIGKLSAEHIFETLSRIVVGQGMLEIQISVSRLKTVLHDVHGLNLKTTPRLEDMASFEVPFVVEKSWHGSTIIRPPSTGTPEDIFNLPPNDLRDLVRGVIWRNEHFNGMTIREIAKRDKRSDAFVGTMIRKSLEIA